MQSYGAEKCYKSVNNALEMYRYVPDVIKKKKEKRKSFSKPKKNTYTWKIGTWKYIRNETIINIQKKNTYMKKIKN